MPNLLELRGVSAGYRPGQSVIHNIDLTVGAGETYGIVGMNGAGKSTLLRVACGGLAPSRGEVLFDGLPVRGGPAAVARRGLVLLPEGHRILSPLTVRENLELATGRLSRRRIRQRLDEDLPFVLELFPDLKPRLGQRAGLLSGGQQQMVSIGRALVQRPKVLLLDEPSLGLAPIIVDAIYEAIGALSARGTSLVVVEQNIDRVHRACSTLLVLRGGQVTVSAARGEIDKAAIHLAYFG